MASPRFLAASMAMERFSFSFGWPVKSANRVGRKAVSNWRSSSSGDPGSRMLSHQLQGFAEHRFKGAGGLGCFGFSHRCFGGRTVAAKIQQRRQYILFDTAEGRFAS